MPAPAIAAALIAGGAQVATGIGNVLSAGAINRRNREFQEKMWNMNNEYNSPVNQMKRFKEAGLNPHLIYGQGNPGNAVMSPAPQQVAPDLSPFANAAMSYLSARKQQTETDNLEMANRVMQSQIVEASARTFKTLAETDKTKLDTQYTRDNYDTLLKQSTANLDLTNTQIDKYKEEIVQIGLQQGKTVLEGQHIAQQIEKMKQEVINLVTTNRLQEANLYYQNIVNDFARQGINFNGTYKDQLFKMIGDSVGIKELGQKTKEGIRRMTGTLWDGLKELIGYK